MARPKNPTPNYRRFHDAARCWVNGRWVQLGKWDSPESYVEHARILAELAATPAARFVSKSSPTVNQVLAAFWLHAEQHYRHPDGKPTNELPQYRQTFAVVRRLYGHTQAEKFGPLALKAVRQTMVDAGWCRLIVNQRVGRVRRAFKWAASEELIPVSVYQGLAAVAGLQSGRTKARDMEPIKPVSQERVDATLPHLQPAVRAMVQVQLLTGMRPGEVCQLRKCDINTNEPVWLFNPVQYKTRYRGKSRVVTIGPKAQAVLKPFLTDDAAAFLFSPRRTVAAFHAQRRIHRKNPCMPWVYREVVAPPESGGMRSTALATPKSITFGTGLSSYIVTSTFDGLMSR
jgi:integrase